MTNRSQTKSGFPDYSNERQHCQQCGGPVAGVDEAGRGPWAGPVLAAAVILDEGNIPDGLNDSKMLNEEQREQLYIEIYATSLVGVGLADIAVIDRKNILGATLYAMKMAVEALPLHPVVALVDGNQQPELPCQAIPLVKGDQLSLSIAAASIIAKVTRDRLMREMAIEFPQYGFENHKGYGTKAHQLALTQYGVTKHHRRSFKPIRKLIENNVS